jgi:hypothetical protein
VRLLADLIERMDWDAFLAQFRWEQGEHVSCIGHTGAGKTTLIRSILHRRAFVAVIATKPSGRDKTMSGIIRQGYRRITEWPPPHRGAAREQRVVLWPDFRRPEDVANQRYQVDRALREIFVAGSWCIFVDEAYYLCHYLGLTKLLELIWTQGRSIGLSLVAGTQRPAFVPLFMYSEATHLFFWRSNDEVNLKRIGGIGGKNAKLIRETVMDLPKHDCLYLNSRTGQMVITRAPRR